MNKISYTSALVYMAVIARAQQTCQSQLPVPDPSAVEDQRQLGRLYFNYMDQCTTDGKVSYKEFITFVENTRFNGYAPEENLRIFQMMDLNNDYKISEDELLRYDQVNNYDPLDLEGHLPPYKAIKDKVFDYLRCYPSLATEADDNGKICKAGYSRADLKAVLPQLLPLENILGDYVSYEAYVSHEFDLRDFDRNGLAEPLEQREHDWHYAFIRSFWNYSKGAGEKRETIIDDGIMTYETWMEKDNLMLTRDYPNGIPDDEAAGRFRSFDRNRDGQLSWWEYWSTIQEDHIQWKKANELFSVYDQEPMDQIITKPELKNYYAGIYPALTDAELDDKVQIFFDEYQAWDNEIDPSKIDDQIDFWEYWVREHYLADQYERHGRHQEHEGYAFDEKTWFVLDINRDFVWTHQELVDQIGLEQANQIFELVGKDIIDVISKQEAQDTLQGDEVTAKVHRFHYAWYALNYSVNVSRQDLAVLDDIDFSNEKVGEFLNVDTYEQLVALFALIDANQDALVSYDEACSHYLHDYLYYCDKVDWFNGYQYSITDPNYEYPPSEFENFWNSVDVDGDDIVQLQAWMEAIAEHERFDEKTEQELIDIYNQYDANSDGDLAVDEAEAAFDSAQP